MRTSKRNRPVYTITIAIKRQILAAGWIFLGSKKVVQVALGHSPADEIRHWPSQNLRIPMWRLGSFPYKYVRGGCKVELKEGPLTKFYVRNAALFVQSGDACPLKQRLISVIMNVIMK